MGKPYQKLSQPERRALVRSLAVEGRSLSAKVPKLDRRMQERILTREFPDQRALIGTLLDELYGDAFPAPGA